VSGCTNCSSKTGCSDRKGEMLATVGDTLAQLYPTRTWGELADQVPSWRPHPDLAALAEELSTVLKTAAFVRPGGDTDLCDYLYVLALGRPPCAVQVRDFGADIPEEWLSLGTIQEQYLRVCVSQLAPMAGVQQVAMDIHATPEGFEIHERPRAGVYDAPFLARMQKLVATLPAYGLTHLDFGEIDEPPRGYGAGRWPTLFGQAEPATYNYLFFPEPATTSSVVWLPGRA
jgi:hypothetical protein